MDLGHSKRRVPVGPIDHSGVKTCDRTGKLRYTTENKARIALADTKIDGAHHDPARREQRVYRCEFCAGWHLTAQEARAG